MNLADMNSAYGYPAVGLGTFIEGDMILVLSAIAAEQGLLKLPGVITAAFVGVFAGDQVYFHLGRRKGLAYIQSRPQWQAKSQRVFDLLRRYQWPVMFGFRFMYGIRIVTPIMIGASGISPWRFFICNFLGTLTWATTIGSLGYIFGQAMKAVLKNVQYYQMWVFIGAALLLLGLYVRGQYHKRQRNLASEADRKSAEKSVPSSGNSQVPIPSDLQRPLN